jgi:hypothetical protein
MVQQKLGPACKRIAVEEVIAGGAPGMPATYVAMGHLYFDSTDAFQTAFAPHARRQSLPISPTTPTPSPLFRLAKSSCSDASSFQNDGRKQATRCAVIPSSSRIMPVGDRSGGERSFISNVLVAPTIEEVGKTSGPMTMKNGNRIVVDYWSIVSTAHAEQTRFRKSVPVWQSTRAARSSWTANLGSWSHGAGRLPDHDTTADGAREDISRVCPRSRVGPCYRSW